MLSLEKGGMSKECQALLGGEVRRELCPQHPVSAGEEDRSLAGVDFPSHPNCHHLGSLLYHSHLHDFHCLLPGSLIVNFSLSPANFSHEFTLVFKKIKEQKRKEKTALVPQPSSVALFQHRDQFMVSGSRC